MRDAGGAPTAPAAAFSAGDMIVAQDGSGDFRTIQAALDTIPRANAGRIVILVREGVYTEKVLIDQNRITLRGQSRKGTRIEYNLPRPEYDKRYDGLGPAVLNVFGDDVIVENLTVENTQPGVGHAFAIYGQPLRFILADCDVLSTGGDTLSLWNTAHGMYYHTNCFFKGAVDFVCPRGWCYIENSQFYEVGRLATLWQDGHVDPDMKFVLRNCSFDGVPDFQLGRNAYPSQFYLLDCIFSKNMADKPIYIARKDVELQEDKALYQRKYFYNCHRDGGDYPWFADNLAQAPTSPKPDQITPSWIFGGRWEPANTDAPSIERVERDGEKVALTFSEDVTVRGRPRVKLADGSTADYVAGNGANRLVFRGGDAKAAPGRLDLAGGAIFGCIATLQTRCVSGQPLPAGAARSAADPPGSLKPLTILVIGDSTVANYDPAKGDKQGWGYCLREFMSDRVTIVNKARNGRSSKSFIKEGLWDEAKKVPADYVLIQFGHNDNPGKGERATDPASGGTYRQYLKQYIDETRAKGAVPILITPLARRIFGKDGKIAPGEANVPYAEAMVAVAREERCAAIDMNKMTRDLFNELGEKGSDALQTGSDRSHFSPAGARKLAAMIAGELERQVPALRPYLDRNALKQPASHRGARP
jgi:pectinesterase